LTAGAACHEGPGMDPDDVTSIIEGLFDIRTEVRRIVAILGGEDDEEEGDQETDS
jgi:hypothetical protein